MTDLDTALAHLQAFREGHGEPGIIDEDSGLTVEHLDVILAARADASGPVSLDQSTIDEVARAGA